MPPLFHKWGNPGSNSVQFSRSVVSNSFRPQALQHTRPPCPSPTPGACSNSCPLSRWCHPTISSSVTPLSSCPQSLPASGSFPMSQHFTWGGQSIGVSTSASVLPMNIQDWSPLGWTGWVSLQSKGLSRVFSNMGLKIRAPDPQSNNVFFNTFILLIFIFDSAGSSLLCGLTLVVVSRLPTEVASLVMEYRLLGAWA